MNTNFPTRERAYKRWLARKQHKHLFAFTNEAFFPTRRWKLSKNLLGAVALAVAFQYTAFAAPLVVQAAPAADEVPIEEAEFVSLPSGTPLTIEEAELLKQNLLIKEVIPIMSEDVAAESPQFAVADLPQEALVPSAEPVEPLETVTEIRSLGIRTMTAYNSEPGQTDDTPCITANGFNVCEHGIEDTVAANFLPFGTKIRIPELFGDRVFIVRDRMNKRYQSRVDIWMLEKSDAKQFGVRRAEIELVID